MCKKIMALSLICFLLIVGVLWGIDVAIQEDCNSTETVSNESGLTTEDVVNGCNESWLSQIHKGIAEREYHISNNSKGLQAPNRANNLRIYFDKKGISVKERASTDDADLLRLSFTGLDRVLRTGCTGLREEDLERRTETKGTTTKDEQLQNTVVRSKDNRVDIIREGITEWFINNPEGLEHGFTIPTRPDGSGDLRLTMSVSAANAKIRGDHIVLFTPFGGKLKYSKLLVEDSKGEKAPAAFEVPDPDTIVILINDSNAVYPLTIDPLLTGTADAFYESDQVGAKLGKSVSGAGDVNGDGYADVIVGAERYDHGTKGEGAAFIYHGGPAGLSPIAATMVESNALEANMGYSVSGAGDVNGDGYADVIVGARQYLSNLNRGAFFVYHGSATGIISTAITKVVSDQDGAFLGMSVSDAGDVNGDGYADVIAGAPYYDNGQTLEGVAYVHHGGPSGCAAMPAVLLEINIASVCMGWCVRNAGDVNGDGYADVIVGAPYYSNGQTNEGAAYVFHGGSSGVSTVATTMIESNNIAGLLGKSVSGAGDVNGDGFADVIIGQTGYNNGQSGEGAAYIHHGSTAGISPITDAIIESNQAYGYMGSEVSSAGDVNGDGYADVIVGAKYYDSGQIDEGVAFVYYGNFSGILTSAASMVQSDQAYSLLGESVSCAGDVNGDGYSDVIVGAVHYENGQQKEGAAFVYHGGARSISTKAADILDSDQAHALQGFSVSGAGDVNRDGYDDVIVGAPLYDNGELDEGAAFIFQGGSFGISPIAVTMMESDQALAGLGFSVSGAGDVNGDGYSDVIVGAPVYDNGSSDEGAAFVYHGGVAGVSKQAAAMVESDQALANMGWSVSSAGDVNGDGFCDVIVGAPTFDNGQLDEGAIFIYHGGATGISTTADVMMETNLVSTVMGYSVSCAGDVNGDGYADVIAGVTSYSNGETEEGAAFVYHGGANGVSTQTAAIVESNQAYANLGTGVSNAGDVNGDGFSDVIVGAWRYDSGQVDEGAAFIYHGSTTGIFTTAAAMVQSNQDWANMGESVSGAGDVNGDGFSDVIVGVPLYDNPNIDEGAAFIYHGSVYGLSNIAAALLDSDQDYAFMGHSVSCAGDVNGDGFADVIAGAFNFDCGQVDEGVAFVHHGNKNGRAVLTMQLRGGPTINPVSQWGLSHDSDEFKVQMVATHPMGRGRVKLLVEYCGPGIPFGTASSGYFTSSAWTDVTAGFNGVTLRETIPGLTKDKLYRWRASVLYAPYTVTKPGITSPFNPSHGPWRRLSGQSAEADIRIGEPGGDRLKADSNKISYGAGGVVNFTLNAGIGNANRKYILLGGVTGVSPGVLLPGGKATLPLNWDLFTDLTLALVNTPAFHNFLGKLDGLGSANAKLDTFGPFASGGVSKLYFAYCLLKPFDFASNPVTISIAP